MSLQFYIPYQGDPYTVGAETFNDWSRGFGAPIGLTVALQPFIIIASMGVSAWQLAQKQTRGSRILFWLLLISAVLVLATFVLACVSAGRSISGWILD